MKLEEMLKWEYQYIYFGWFDSTGNFIYPTREQTEDPDIIYNHTELLLRGSYSNENQESLKGMIYKEGYIRIQCEYYAPEVFQMTLSPYHVSLPQIQKGFSQFEDAVISGELFERMNNPTLMRYYPNGIPFPERISVGIILHREGTGRQSQYRPQELTKEFPFNVSTVWNYIKHIKETRPPTKYDLKK